MAKKKNVKKYVYKSPMYGEMSTDRGTLYGLYGIGNYNPDELVGKKGIQIYTKMRYDDQIKATLMMKKYARLATPWEIEPASRSERDVLIAKFIKDQLTGMSGTFEGSLYEIYSGLDYGYSLTEIVYKPILMGKWVGKVGLKALKTRNPENYTFETDPQGNLLDNGIVFQGSEKYPTDKFIIYSYNKEFGNWFGNADLRSCYRSWWSKDILIKFHNIYLERFGMPVAVGKYKRGTQEPQVTNLRAILDNIQAKYSITIPDDIIIEFLQVAGGGDIGFRHAIEMHNKFISRAILVPSLMGFTESGGGSYTLGKKQFDVFLWVLKKLGRDTEEAIVNEQLIRKLVDINFDVVDEYPKFRFESLTEEDTEAKARIVRLGVDGGLINPAEAWVRPYLNIPRRDENVPLPQPKTAQGQPIGTPHPGGESPAMGKKGTPSGESAVPKERLWVSPKYKPDKFKEYVLEVDGHELVFGDMRYLYDEVKRRKKKGMLKGEDKILVYTR